MYSVLSEIYEEYFEIFQFDSFHYGGDEVCFCRKWSLLSEGLSTLTEPFFAFSIISRSILDAGNQPKWLLILCRNKEFLLMKLVSYSLDLRDNFLSRKLGHFIL